MKPESSCANCSKENAPRRCCFRSYPDSASEIQILRTDLPVPVPIFSRENLGIPVSWIGTAEVEQKIDELTCPGNAAVRMYPDESKYPVIDHLTLKRIPQLLFNRVYRECDYLLTDPVSSIREGLAWLMIEAGREIAFVTHEPCSSRPYLSPRIIAFYQLCVELGAHLNTQMLFSRSFRNIPEEIAEIGARIFTSEKPPKGIFVMSCELALPLVICARNYHRIPGKDFFLLVFDFVPELEGYPGVAMMRQQYPLFYQQVPEWIRFRNNPQTAEKRFSIPIKTELLSPKGC